MSQLPALPMLLSRVPTCSGNLSLIVSPCQGSVNEGNTYWLMSQFHSLRRVGAPCVGPRRPAWEYFEGFVLGVGMQCVSRLLQFGGWKWVWQLRPLLPIACQKGDPSPQASLETSHTDTDKQDKCASPNLVPELNENTLPMVVWVSRRVQPGPLSAL